MLLHRGIIKVEGNYDDATLEKQQQKDLYKSEIQQK